MRIACLVLALGTFGCARPQPRPAARPAARALAPAAVAPSVVATTPAVPPACRRLEELAGADTPMIPCAVGSDAHEAARKRLSELSELLRALPDSGDPTPGNQALCELLADPCFAIARELRYEPGENAFAADSNRALRAFWRDGGEAWLNSMLDLGATDTIAVPPALRPTLALDVSPGHRLARLLCETSDRDCGAETRGWLQRANAAFEAFEDQRWLKRQDEHDADEPTEPRPSPARCAQNAKAQPADQRLAGWFDCVRGLGRRDALPHGAFRAPNDGWFVIRGRRGHYGFCDEVRAYDLATGSAYVARSCSKLALKTGGDVDHGATDAARNDSSTMGKLPLDNLREAVLATLLIDEISRNVVVSGESYDLPSDIGRTLGPERTFTLHGGRFSWSSAQTTLQWLWIADGTIVANGDLSWPRNDDQAARQHAVELLQIAEAGLAEGCPVVSLPADLPLGTPASGGVARPDAEPARLERVQHTLEGELAALSRNAEATCRGLRNRARAARTSRAH